MGTARNFVKMQGLRNHFVIVDARDAVYQPVAEEIIRVCDVQVGVGADQLVVIEAPTDKGKKQAAAAFVRFFNVDGLEAEACGNATRCVAHLLLEEAGDKIVFIETKNGVLKCEHAGQRQVRCSMGVVSMDWRDIPLAEARDTSHLGLESGPLVDPAAVCVGNPHAVFFVANPDAIDMSRHAPEIQSHALFPQQVNVGAAAMTGEDSMRLVVYERGAGLTTACGSGACAAVYAALARGLTESRAVKVTMPAGSVLIEIARNDEAIMTGPVAHCFRGQY